MRRWGLSFWGQTFSSWGHVKHRNLYMCCETNRKFSTLKSYDFVISSLKIFQMYCVICIMKSVILYVRPTLEIRTCSYYLTWFGKTIFISCTEPMPKYKNKVTFQYGLRRSTHLLYIALEITRTHVMYLHSIFSRICFWFFNYKCVCRGNIEI